MAQLTVATAATGRDEIQRVARTLVQRLATSVQEPMGAVGWTRPSVPNIVANSASASGGTR